MRQLLIATTNKGKIREYTQLLFDLKVKLVFLKDVGITEDVEEIGKSYRENAQLKAVFYAQKSNLPAISDDGGLEIRALGGNPGIHSRRWVGGEGKDEDIVKKMIEVSQSIAHNNRKAVFKIVVAFALPNGKVYTKTGSTQGIISKKPNLKLMKGYPYRSFLYFPRLKKHYHESELTMDEQKEYNHRYKAVRKLIPTIKKVLGINQ